MLLVASVCTVAACVEPVGSASAVVESVASAPRERTHIHYRAEIQTVEVGGGSPTSAASIARLRGRSTDELTRMLTTTRGRVRRDVMYDLVRRGPPPAAQERIIELIPDEYAGIAAAHAILRMGDEAVGTLRERLEALGPPPAEGDPDPVESERDDLEWTLEEIEWLLAIQDAPEPSSAPAPPPPTIGTLSEWLQSEDAEERARGAAAAGRRGAEGQILVPLIADAMAYEYVRDLPEMTEAMRELGAQHEALLIIRARMAREPVDRHSDEYEALAELGEFARDDVAARVAEYIAQGDQFDRARAFKTMKATGVDARPHEAAIVAALSGREWEMKAAAVLLGAHPQLAREHLAELVAAITSKVVMSRSGMGAGILRSGGLPGDLALELLDVSPYWVRNELMRSIGPDSAQPGDALSRRLFEIAATSERDGEVALALSALRRAGAADERDVDRLLDLMEAERGGAYLLGDVCRTSSIALPRLLRLLEENETSVTWPLAMIGPRAAAAIPRLALEARDQDGGAAFALGAIGAVAAAELRDVLEGQHDVLRRDVVAIALTGVRDSAEDREPEHVDAACRAFLALYLDVDEAHLGPEVAPLLADDDSDVRWAAGRVIE